MQSHQNLIQYAVTAEHDDPAIQADQPTGPERDHDKQQHSALPYCIHLCHKIPIRVADQRHEQCGRECQLQRLQKSIQIQRFQYAFVIIQCKCKIHTPDLRTL